MIAVLYYESLFVNCDEFGGEFATNLFRRDSNLTLALALTGTTNLIPKRIDAVASNHRFDFQAEQQSSDQLRV